MKLVRPAILLAAFVTAVIVFRAAATGPQVEPLVLRVYYEEPEDIQRLSGYDLFETRNAVEGYVLVGGDQDTLEKLARQGWRVEVDQDQTAALWPADGRPIWGGYRTVDEIYALLAAHNSAAPTLTNLVDYGDSYCKQVGGCTTPGGESSPGFDLVALRITNKALTDPKPPFFMLANIHAREYTPPELSLRFIDWLLDNYGVDPDATWLVDHHDIWVVPIANPDGHWLAEIAVYPPYERIPFMQRKNGHMNGCTTWPPVWNDHYGIDLNRNHTVGWGGAGSNTGLCEAGYRGTAPASEPEVAALETLLLTIFPDQRGPGAGDAAPLDTTGLFLTLHSAGNWVLWPWSHLSSAAPNAAGLQAIGSKLASYNGYTACQSGNCLYVASGTSDDFVYGETGVPSFVYEIGDAFVPPYEEIDAIQWPDNAPSFIHAARLARAPYRLAPGPDVLTPTVTVPSTLGPGDRFFVVGATVDDTTTGNLPLTTAVYQLDTPYWQTGAISHTLNASDGTFDTPVETVSAVIDACDPLLVNGTHTVWLRGRDNAGNWGAPWAASFDVSDPGCAPTAVLSRAAATHSPSASPLLTLSIVILGLLTLRRKVRQ